MAGERLKHTVEKNNRRILLEICEKHPDIAFFCTKNRVLAIFNYYRVAFPAENIIDILTPLVAKSYPETTYTSTPYSGDLTVYKFYLTNPQEYCKNTIVYYRYSNRIDSNIKFNAKSVDIIRILRILHRTLLIADPFGYGERYRVFLAERAHERRGSVVGAWNALTPYGYGVANFGENINAHFINDTVSRVMQKRGLNDGNNKTRKSIAKNIKQMIKRGVRFNNRGHPISGIEESKNDDD